MSDTVPPLPPGFTLDAPEAATPPPPPGFTLDAAPSRPAPGLGERFARNFERAHSGTTTGLAENTRESYGARTRGAAAAGATSMFNLTPAQNEAADAAQNQVRTQQKQRAADYEAMPGWSGPLEGLTALFGQLAGGLLAPENMIGDFLGAGKTIGGVVGRRAAENAAVGGAADAGVQTGEQHVLGTRDAFDPAQTAGSAALGAAIGGGVPLALHGLGVPVVPRDAPAPPHPDTPPPVAEVPALPAPGQAASDIAAAQRPPTPPADIPQAVGHLQQQRTDLAGQGRPVDEAGNPDANWSHPPGSPEAKKIAELDARIAELQARDAAQTPGPETAPRYVAPEGGAPRDAGQVQQGREARQAFDQAAAQRERASEGVRDTQPAPRPEGVNPQPVLLDQGYPVRVVGDDGSGHVSVERYDPRTGQPAEDAVPYVVRRSTLTERLYAANPRQAQDFTARSESPRNPEVPRDAGPGRPIVEPRQTYRATAADPNAEFPGATRPGPPEGEAPLGRSPLPVQPDAPQGRRWSSAEEAERAFQDRRAYAEAEAQRARESGEWQSGKQSTNQPGAQDADGRWPVDQSGYVASTAGGPIRFGDQKQAAKWIIAHGQAKSPDQFFEIAVHPSGQGFTVREAGRNPGGGGGRAPGGGAAPEAGAPPRGTATEPPQLGGPHDRDPARSAERPDGGAGGEGTTARPAGEAGDPTTAARPTSAGVETPDRVAPEPAAKPDIFAQSRARTAERKAAADDLAGSGRPVRFTKPGGRSALAGPDVSKPGAFRVTRFDDAGPVGHTEHPTLHEAVLAALREGYAAKSNGAVFPPLYSAPFDPAAIKRFLVEPAGRALVKFRDYLRTTTAAGAFRTFFDSNRGALAIYREMFPKVPEIGILMDHLASDPGGKRTVAGTFQTEVTSRSQGTTNRVMAVLGKGISAEDARAVRDVLTGARAKTPEIADKAKRIRKILEEHHAYLRASGVEVGKQANYFPRQYDETLIAADPSGFRAAVAREYEKAGMSAADAQDQARAFFDEVTGQAAVGFRNEALLSANSLKGRTLPASADAALAKFMVTDPQVALSRYFARTTRVAEFTKRFGKNGDLAAEWFSRMKKQGVPPDVVEMIQRHFESATGTGKPGASVPYGSAAAGWIQTAGIVARLTGSVISSLPEALAVGARYGNPAKGLNALVDMFRGASKDMAHAKQIAEWLGVVGVSGPDMTLAAQAGAIGQTPLQQKITDGLFKLNGLHQLTDRQRVVATKYADLFVRQMAEEVVAGAKTKASAARLLAELGIEEQHAAGLLAWMKKGPGEAEVTGTSAEAQRYRTAVTRFVNETIQNPEAIDKPMWSAHPIGRLAYGITSFQYAFTRNVLMRTFKQAGEALSGTGLGLADRARLVGPLVGMSVLMAAQAGVSWARDKLGNSKQRNERDPVVNTLSIVDRMGIFGNMSPVVNMVSSAKYEADPSSRVVGPYVSNVTNILKDLMGTTPQPFGPNSPRTNNAEHRAAQTFYQGVLAPAVVAALAVAPLPTLLKVAAGAAAVVGTRPDFARGFADAVAGPKKVKARSPGSRFSAESRFSR